MVPLDKGSPFKAPFTSTGKSNVAGLDAFCFFLLRPVEATLDAGGVAGMDSTVA